MNVPQIPKEVLSIGLDELKTNLFGFMQELVKDCWKKEDTAFLKQLAEDVAQEAWAARNGQEGAEKHRQNLMHLAATLKGEIVRKQLQIKMFRKDIFADLLMMVIKTVASVLLQAAKNKAPIG